MRPCYEAALRRKATIADWLAWEDVGEISEAAGWIVNKRQRRRRRRAA